MASHGQHHRVQAGPDAPVPRHTLPAEVLCDASGCCARATAPLAAHPQSWPWGCRTGYRPGTWGLRRDKPNSVRLRHALNSHVQIPGQHPHRPSTQVTGACPLAARARPAASSKSRLHGDLVCGLTRGRDHLHDLLLAAVRAHRHAAADDLRRAASEARAHPASPCQRQALCRIPRVSVSPLGSPAATNASTRGWISMPHAPWEAGGELPGLSHLAHGGEVGGDAEVLLGAALRVAVRDARESGRRMRRCTQPKHACGYSARV
jgi:hypothetical protein